MVQSFRYNGKRLSWEFKDLRLNLGLFFHLAISPESWVGCQANDEPDRYTPGPSELAAHDFQVKAKWADEIPLTLPAEGSEDPSSLLVLGPSPH